MKGFRFKDNKAKVLTLEIEGEKYTFIPNTYEVRNAIEFFNKRNDQIRNKLSKEATEKELANSNLKLLNLCESTVNAILGKGSYRKIFAGRPVSLDENEELLSYIFTSITDFCNKEADRMKNEKHTHNKAAKIN